MAELRRSNKTLEWERLPDGRLAIALNTAATLADGSVVEAPDCMFLLSPEEEADLKAVLLYGLKIAGAMPAPGGVLLRQ